MKTKIIYISGDEVFDMADIRAAFEEVRGALNLGPDTVLFGVPVDTDNSLATTVTTPQADTETNTPVPITNDIVTESVMDTVAVGNPLPETEPMTVEPAPKKTRGRPRATKKAEETILESTEHAPTTDNEKVIPILSILATKAEEDKEPDVTTPAESIQETITHPDDTTTTDDNLTKPVMETNAETEIAAEDNDVSEPVAEQIETTVIESVTIEEVIIDDMPTEPSEKTLEELLESMTPLREDVIGEDDFVPATDADDDMPVPDSDTDATLEQLATEFAENQDKIVPLTTKAESQGKIGKLKNILPFKKVKRDDSGIMGDLFGWAGIAANDEEFSMPGFFTSAAAKK